MLELLSAILIIAVLATMVTFFTASYIQWSQQVADQRTLVVLNDALTRYKCAGGDLTALTSGAPAGHIISKLTNPINWNGYVHQVMQTGVTYSSKSLTGAGYHQTFKFTGYNSYSTPVNPGQDIVDRLASQGTPPDSATANWIQTNATSPYYLVLSQPSSSTTIGMTVTIVGTLYVNWGDDTTATYSGSTTITHTYASAGNYGVILSGQVTSFISVYADGHTAFGGDISTMPTLTFIKIAGTNTITGNITAMTGLTYVNAEGSSALSGSITNLTGLTTLWLTASASTSITGSLTNLTNLTTIYIDTAQNISGDITGLTSLTKLQLNNSSNTVTGSVTGKALTWLSAYGSNTISGDITSMTGLTLLSVGGSNTVTGTLSAPGIGYLIEGGNSTVTNPADWSGYTTLCDVTVRGLSTQSAVDNFLTSMSTNKNASKGANWWSSYRIINCNGANNATPSSTGLTAKTSLIGSGWTVNTN